MDESPPGTIGAPSSTGRPVPTRSLPSGFVTFVLTDIEGSTRLLKRLPELAPDLFDRHDEILRSAWLDTGGHEVSTEGDSFFVAFADTGDALAACSLAQERLAAEPWPNDEKVSVRMGIHAGIAAQRGDNYIALAIHQAARVSSAAHGGQILVTDTAAQRGRPPDNARLVSLGRFRLRDFEEPELLYRLDTVGVEVNDRLIRATPADGHNLVKQPTKFMGRDGDLASIMPLLGPGRTVTLTGPGGVGKTRLATEVGLAVGDDWPDGVWMVELADLGDSALIADTMAEAIGARIGDSSSRWDDVVAHLVDRRALVILDNTEHHLEVCASIVLDLITRCDRVGILATGREPLKIPGETIYRVAPLAVPVKDDRNLERIQLSTAVQLFCDRARLAQPDFQLDADSALAVARICARLDGLPLALEIAGARVGVLTLDEMLTGLNDRFRLLKSQDRTLPERQRTMEGLLDWSYRLLDREEQAALRRLAVFGGSFSIDAASHTVAADDISPDMVPELVWALVDKSLVVADLSDSESRYRLPESARDYAQRLLDQLGEGPPAAARLAGWLLERVGPWLITDRRWIGRVGVELANMRGLVGALASTEPEVAQQLAYSIGLYHHSLQSFATAIDELTRTADEVPAETPTRVALLTSLADLHLRRSDVDAARKLLGAATELQSRVGPPAWADAAVGRTRGEIEIRSGDFDAGREIAERALAGTLSVQGQARMWNLLGIVHYTHGDVGEAAVAFERELDGYTRLGHEANMASAHGNIAEVSMQLGDPATAARHQLQCLDLALVLGQPIMLAYSCILASRLAGARGSWELAVQLQTSADAVLASAGHALYEFDLDAERSLMESARSALGDTDFQQAVEAGTALEITEATQLATGVLFETASAESGDAVEQVGEAEQRSAR